MLNTDFDTSTLYSLFNTRGTLSSTENGIRLDYDGTTSNNGIILPLAYPGCLKNGQKYTLSFKYRTNLTSTGNVYVIQKTIPNVALQINQELLPSDNEWQQFRCTFSSDDINARVCTGILIPYASGAGKWIEIMDKSLKLEEGESGTSWQPAYEDLKESAKTATNYMNASSSGLVIGDMTANTLGKNVLIDNDSVDIRVGTTVLSSFGESTIYLGKNSETSVINLCNGAATMRVKDSTDFRIYTDKRLVMSAYDSMLLDCWRNSTHMTRIAIQSSDPDDASRVGGVQFTIYQGDIENTVSMLRNNIELKVTDGTNETRFNLDEKIVKIYAADKIRLNGASSVQIGESSSYAAGILLGNTAVQKKSINCYWTDGKIHDMLNNNNGQETYLGPVNIDESTTTYIRGNTVRIYAHSGGVYLGASGSTAITSDRNMKKDIIDIDNKYIDFFDRLRPITYKYNDGHRDHIGFIAQEVEDALTASGLTTEQFAGLIIEKDVTLNPNYDTSLSDEENKANEIYYDTLYSLRYEEFISLLVKKVQDLQKQINDLKGE